MTLFFLYAKTISGLTFHLDRKDKYLGNIFSQSFKLFNWNPWKNKQDGERSLLGEKSQQWL